MGKTKQLIDELIEKKSKGIEYLKISTRMKLLMKGIDVQKINDNTPDDLNMLKKIHQIASELNITLTKK